MDLSQDQSAAADDVAWLSAEQKHEWRVVVELLAVLPVALDAQLKRDAGMNLYEFQVLASLSEAPGQTLGLSDLAETARGSLSRLSHALTRLERSGLVERRACTERAGRRAEARLTEAGTARLRQIAPGHVAEVRRLVVDVLSATQLSELGDIARAINAVTRAETPSACHEANGC